MSNDRPAYIFTANCLSETAVAGTRRMQVGYEKSRLSTYISRFISEKIVFYTAIVTVER